MFKQIQEFLKELQEASEARKWRWLLGTSVVAGGVVIFLWNIQFSHNLVIPNPELQATEQAALDASSEGAPSLLGVLARRLSLLQDSVWSMFFGPSNIPVPAN